MLDELRITGLGVIEDTTLPLTGGMNVITGETGAGKTMVVTGLGLLFGGRADAARVRAEPGRAVVEGRLRLTGPAAAAVQERVADAGAEPDTDGSLLLSRTVTAEGRSRAHVGGRSVPVSVLAELGEDVVAVHGQSDQLRLLRPAEQRAALDRFGATCQPDQYRGAGAEHEKLLAGYREAYLSWRRVTDDLADRTRNARERRQEADLLRLGLDEVSRVDPQSGEDEQLRAEAQRLEHAEGLRTAAQAAYHAVAGDPAGNGSGAEEVADAAGLLGTAHRTLESQATVDAKLGELAARLAEAAAQVGDVAAELAGYLDALDADPDRLTGIYERRAALRGLTRKYAEDADGVIAWAERARQRLAELDSSDELLAELAAEAARLAQESATLGARLTAARQGAAQRFAAEVSSELAGLAMPHARIEVLVSPRPPGRGEATLTIASERSSAASDAAGVAASERSSAASDAAGGEVDGGGAADVAATIEVGAGPDGLDEIELRLVAHPGAPALPLQKGASGGELSRVMLAIEVVFAGAGGPETLVFDEVDAGVGGRAAVEIGRRLARLARRHQVLVVTHLPQVAAFADQHLVVAKDSGGAITTSGVRVVEDTERARELARMLAGLPDSDLGIAHAEELLAVAGRDKRG